MRNPLLLVSLLAACTGAQSPTTRHNDIPARVQWEGNYGYCGEVSLISAALYHGAYLSQYDARALASPNVDQSLESSQLLLGVNDVAAATAMHLTSEPWTGPIDAHAFLVWVRAHVAAGDLVAIGLYMNESIFDDTGDPEYDHIVPVIAVDSRYADGAYHGDDTLTFSDNALDDDSSTHLFTSTFDALVATRAQADVAGAPPYALSSATRDYGIAITGIDADTLPVRVDTSVATEDPSIVDGSSQRPAAMPLELTITVSGLTAGTDYVLYRYDDFSKVPTSAFNAHASNAASSTPIHASADHFVTTLTILSNQIAAFRAVPSSAP